MRADRRLCLDRSGSRLVEESDLDAAIMVAPKGDEVPLELVKRLGLVVWADGRVMQGPEPAPTAAPRVDAPLPDPAPLLHVAPLDGIVHPAGAMPEPKPKAAPKKPKD